MRTIEIRRHSLTKKGEGRGAGSHLSQAGVELARRIGAESGPFDRVLVSPVPRTMETALAMGYAVDAIVPALGPEDPDLFAAIGHHERWGWDDPFAEFARLVRGDGPARRLGRTVAECWRSVLTSLPDGGRALIISHGRVIECGLVAFLPDADVSSWGAPFQHGEGVRLVEDDTGEVRPVFLRVAKEPCSRASAM